jgi:hypothetical protein
MLSPWEVRFIGLILSAWGALNLIFTGDRSMGENDVIVVDGAVRVRLDNGKDITNDLIGKEATLSVREVVGAPDQFATLTIGERKLAATLVKEEGTGKKVLVLETGLVIEPNKIGDV